MRAKGAEVRDLGAGTSADWHGPASVALDDGRPAPTAVLRPVGRSGVYGSASFSPYPTGTNAALVVHGLRPARVARARLYAGRSLGSLGVIPRDTA